jgi:hypothetical protein
MKIRLIEPGWENLTGQFGAHEFVDGVSVEDLSKADATHLANIIRVENVDTGANPSDSQKVLDHYNDVAPVEAVPVKAEPPAAVVIDKVYTGAELEALADEQGIKGLREIADKWGIKATSIAKLIAEMIAFQKDHAKPAEKTSDEVVMLLDERAAAADLAGEPRPEGSAVPTDIAREDAAAER